MARLVKVWFILWGVLALAGCAGMGSPSVKPEKLVLDWKDFYSADFISSCNRVYPGKGKIKTVTQTCYQTSNRNTDQYSLVIDVSTFDPAEQSLFENQVANKTEFQKTMINQFIGLDCASSVNRIRDNAFSCQINNGQNMLLVMNFVLGQGKIVESRLVLFPDQLASLNNEYQTAMRIISEQNLRPFLSD